MFGCLGTCIEGNFYGELARSTNKIDFMEYLENLSTKLTVVGCRPWFILDNHSAHRSK